MLARIKTCQIGDRLPHPRLLKSQYFPGERQAELASGLK